MESERGAPAEPEAGARDPGRLSREVVVAGTPEAVFAALGDPEALAVWLSADVELEAEPGGRYRFQFLATGDARAGQVTRFEPPRAIAWSWVEDAEMTTVTIEVSPTDVEGDTLVELVHAGLPTYVDEDGDLVPAPRTEELACLWAFRLEALRAYLEGQADLFALTGVAHLFIDRLSVERSVLASPHDAHRALEAMALASGEVALGGRPPWRLVTLRTLEGSERPTVIEATIEPEGAGIRLVQVQTGFTADETWWTEAERALLLPAVPLAQPDEELRLAARATALAERLEPRAVSIDLPLPIPRETLFDALSDPTRLRALVPGAHEAPDAPGGPYTIRRFDDQPAERVGSPTQPSWPGLEAVLWESGEDTDLHYLDLEVPVAGGPARPLAIEARAGGPHGGCRLVVQETGFGGDDRALDQARAFWGRFASELERSASGGVDLWAEVLAPKDLVFQVLTRPDAMATWLAPGIRAAAGEAAEGPIPGAPAAYELPADEGEPRRLLRVLAGEPGVSLELSWPFGNADALARPLTLRFTLAPRLDGEATRLSIRLTGIETKDPVLLAFAVERQRAELARLLVSLRARAENGVGLAGLGLLPIGDGRIALQVVVRASPSHCFDAILDEASPLMDPEGAARAEEHGTRSRVDRFGGGAWETARARGILLRVEPDREVEHTFPALQDDEPLGATIARWELEGFGGGTRVTLTERGFHAGPGWDARLVRQQRRWRMLLEELRVRAEAPGRTLLLPGVRTAIAEGAIRFHQDLAAPLGSVYARVATAEGLRSWLCEAAEVGERLGDPVRLAGCRAPLPRTIAGLVLARQPGAVAAYLAPSPRDGATQAIRFILEPFGEGTRLYLIHEGFAPERAPHADDLEALGSASGWPALLGRLGRALAR